MESVRESNDFSLGARQEPTEKVMFMERPEGGETESYVDICGRTVQ